VGAGLCACTHQFLSRAATDCQRVCSAVDSDAMLDWSACEAVERIPGKVSGIWLFKGSRVPVKALFENLEDGASVDDFLTWFPGVTPEQVQTVLEHAAHSLAA
jgi:uncharacterized protein (DUF433 family)